MCVNIILKTIKKYMLITVHWFNKRISFLKKLFKFLVFNYIYITSYNMSSIRINIFTIKMTVPSDLT